MFRDRLPLTVDGFNVYDNEGIRVLMAGTNEHRPSDGEAMARFFVNAIHRNFKLPEVPEPEDTGSDLPAEPDNAGPSLEEIQGEVGLEVVRTAEDRGPADDAFFAEPQEIEAAEFESAEEIMDNEPEDEGPTPAMVAAFERHAELQRTDEPDEPSTTKDGPTVADAPDEGSMEAGDRDPVSALMEDEGMSEEDAIEMHRATTKERESDGGAPLVKGKAKPVEVAAILKRPGRKKRTLA